MSVAAVVVHWNSRARLPACLQALGHDPRLQVVVVDNASPDGGEREIRDAFPSVRWHAMGRNAGFGAAVNAGARQAASDWILALNPDAVVPGGDVLRLSEWAALAGVAAVGPLLFGPDGAVERSWDLRDSALGDLGRFFAWRLRLPLAAPRGPIEVAWLSGACLLVRRDAFERAGGFDERFFLYFEDADLCRRLRRAGGRVMLHPGFRAEHQRGGSAGGDLSRMRLHYRRSQLRFFRLHRPAWARVPVRAAAWLQAAWWSAPWSPPELRQAARELLRPPRAPEDHP